MKTWNLVLAVVMFGGVLFTAQATNIIDLDAQTTTQVDKRNLKIPTDG